MAKQTRTPFAILGLLTLYPMTGYDLKQFYERSLRYFWRESFGQIYPALKRLKADGFVVSEVRPGARGRDRILYEITPAGREALRDWLERPVAQHPMRNELLLKLFFGAQSNVATTTTHIQQALSEAEARRQVYQSIESVISSENPDPYGSMLQWFTLDYGRRSTEMIIAWSENALKMLEGIEKGPDEDSGGMGE